ncbi:hypothetical protein AMTR_s00268p00005320, partial [Amborella trichopoda]
GGSKRGFALVVGDGAVEVSQLPSVGRLLLESALGVGQKEFLNVLVGGIFLEPHGLEFFLDISLGLVHPFHEHGIH